MADTQQDQIDGFVRAINDHHIGTVRDEDAGLASDAAASLHSGSGYLSASGDVLEAFTRALEVGYAAALQDFRRGRLDAEVREWRPELFEGE